MGTLVAGAMVVNIFSFFDFGNHGAPAMTIGQQTMKQKVILLPSGRTAGMTLEHQLNLIKERLTDDWVMGATGTDY